MERCPTCGGRTFGTACCIVCEEPFIKRREDQITCASEKCKKSRLLQKQKIWKRENDYGAARFPYEYVICVVCGDKVQKVRTNQATCHSEECLRKHGASNRYRGLKAKYVYGNLG